MSKKVDCYRIEINNCGKTYVTDSLRYLLEDIRDMRVGSCVVVKKESHTREELLAMKEYLSGSAET